MEMVTALRGARCTWYGITHGTSFGGDHVIEHAGDFSLVRVEHTIPVLW
jgi:hypothetical protein